MTGNADDGTRSIPERVPRLPGAVRSASEVLLCLDFDGTLAPIVDDPADATMTPGHRAALETLTAVPSVRVAVVSGRALSDVRSRVGLDVTYAGNHGLELAAPDDEAVAVHPIAEARSTVVERVCEALRVALDPLPGTRVENKRLTGTVHVRSTPPPARPVATRLTRAVVDRLGGDDLKTSPGKRIVEIEPALEWGKGDAVALLADRHSGDPLVLYVGDDVTDESAFREVEPEGIGVRVGNPTDRDTAASTTLRSPAAVASLLEWLGTTGVELLDERPTGLPAETATGD